MKVTLNFLEKIEVIKNNMKREYLIIIEKGKNNLSAYVPDLPGCIAPTNTEKEILKLMEEGIELHIEDMKQRGYVDNKLLKESTSSGEYVIATANDMIY